MTFEDKSRADRKSTRLNSSHLVISYAVFCLKKKKDYKRQVASRHDAVDKCPAFWNQMASYFAMCYLFFFNDTATTEIYTLSLHDALPISMTRSSGDRKPRIRAPVCRRRI